MNYINESLLIKICTLPLLMQETLFSRLPILDILSWRGVLAHYTGEKDTKELQKRLNKGSISTDEVFMLQERIKQIPRLLQVLNSNNIWKPIAEKLCLRIPLPYGKLPNDLFCKPTVDFIQSLIAETIYNENQSLTEVLFPEGRPWIDIYQLRLTHARDRLITLHQICVTAAGPDESDLFDNAPQVFEVANKGELAEKEMEIVRIVNWIKANKDAVDDIVELNLSELTLTYLSSDICDLPSLNMLDLTDNRLSNLPLNFTQLTDLRHLSLYGNNFYYVPSQLGSMNISQLNLLLNPLREIPEWLSEKEGLTIEIGEEL